MFIIAHYSYTHLRCLCHPQNLFCLVHCFTTDIDSACQAHFNLTLHLKNTITMVCEAEKQHNAPHHSNAHLVHVFIDQQLKNRAKGMQERVLCEWPLILQYNRQACSADFFFFSLIIMVFIKCIIICSIAMHTKKQNYNCHKSGLWWWTPDNLVTYLHLTLVGWWVVWKLVTLEETLYN